MPSKTTSPIGATIWSFIERLSSEAMTFVIGVVLARLLAPSDYGIIGLTTIFIVISNVFIDSGFSNALIRKIDRNEKDLSTAFLFNLAVGSFLYALLFVCAGVIADFFEEPLLVILIRIVGLNVLLNSLCIVQNALLTAQLNIRLLTIINLSSQIPSGIVAIYLAYSGFGVYALAIQTVMCSFIKTIMLWFFAEWRPAERFNMQSFHYLWGFGSKLLLSSLIGTIIGNLHSFLIGKYIGKSDLGYYSKGNTLSMHVSSITIGIVQKVGLPLLSQYQHNIDELRSHFQTMMKLLVLIIAPLSAFFVYEAKDIVLFLWTDKWLDTVPMFQLIVCCVVLGPMGAMSLSLMSVMNRTDIVLKIEILKKSVFLAVIFYSFQYGIFGLLIGQIFNNVFAALVNMYPTKNLLRYSYMSQLIDVSKYVIYAYVIGLPLFYVIATDSHLLNIILFFALYFSTYCLFLRLIKDELFLKYSVVFINTLKNKFSHK